MRPASILIPVIVVLTLLGLAALPVGHAQPVGGTVGQYLPLVFKAFPPTETPTATNTPVPTSTPEPTATAVPIAELRNGTFEQGNTVWTVADAGYDVIRTGFPSGFKVHGGKWAAWLGGVASTNTGIVQTVTIPVDRPYLVYWRWIASQDICYRDVGGAAFLDGDGVVSDDEIVDSYKLCFSNNSARWERRSINVSRFAGQTRDLYILAGLDSLLNSNLFIDDVSFQASPSTASDQAPSDSPTGLDAPYDGPTHSVVSNTLPADLVEQVRAHVTP